MVLWRVGRIAMSNVNPCNKWPPNSWLPEANPPPFPDCSVVTHATMAVTSTVFNFDIDGSYGDDLEEFDSICDDQRLMVKVNESPTGLDC